MPKRCLAKGEQEWQARDYSAECLPVPALLQRLHAQKAREEWWIARTLISTWRSTENDCFSAHCGLNPVPNRTAGSSCWLICGSLPAASSRNWADEGWLENC